jgi:hypothetical protein
MRKMSWTHSSRSVAFGVLLAIALAVGMAGIAAAADFEADEEPEPTIEGEEVSMEVISENPFNEFTEWTLVGSTELEEPGWTITLVDNTGEETSVGYEGESFEHQLNGSENIVEVHVQVNGNAPSADEFDYEDLSVEQSTAIELTRAQGSETLGTWNVRSITEESQNAREALDSAQSVIEGSGNTNAEERFQEAVTFYNSGEFESAISAAEDAESMVDTSGGLPLPLLIGGGVVVLLIVAGGFYVYRQRQRNTNKLR